MLRENWINNEAKDFPCYDILWKQQTKATRDSRRLKATIQIFRSGAASRTGQRHFSGPEAFSREGCCKAAADETDAQVWTLPESSPRNQIFFAALRE